MIKLRKAWLDLIVQYGVITPAWSLVALLGLVPLLILRKTRLSTLRAPGVPNRLATLSLLARRSTWTTLAAYLISWAFLSFAWWQLSQSGSQEADLSILTHVKNGKQLNPRFVYLLLTSFTLTLLSAARHETSQFSNVDFPHSSTPDKIPLRAARALLDRFMGGTASLLITLNFAMPVGWVLVRRPILKALVYHTAFRFVCLP